MEEVQKNPAAYLPATGVSPAITGSPSPTVQATEKGLFDNLKGKLGNIPTALKAQEAKASVAFKGLSPKVAAATKIGAYSVEAAAAIDGARRMWTAKGADGKFSLGKFTAGLAETGLAVGAAVVTRRITR